MQVVIVCDGECDEFLQFGSLGNVIIAERLADILAPAGCTTAAFLKRTTTLDTIWEREIPNDTHFAAANTQLGTVINTSGKTNVI